MTTTTLPSRQTLLNAVSRRDPAWDGLFVFAVRTTGVACRPTCPSRRARPQHVEFFPTLDEARSAGFRPCRRCHPEAPSRDPEWWQRLLALVHATPRTRLPDAEMRRLGFDPVQVRRHALRAFGMTFHAWLRTRRVAEAQQQLNQGAPLDEVIMDSAWQSHSGFRDAFSQVVGTPPGKGRGGEPIYAMTWQSPIGPLVAAAVEAGIVLLEFGELERLERQAPTLRRWFKGPVVAERHHHLDQLKQELDEYFAGDREEFTVPMVLRGTSFELSVWNALRRIPYGVTCSYADIAREVDNPKAVRAVGSANGRNRMSIIIPCHRVVNTDGKLGGYGGGLWRKIRLLEIEGVMMRQEE
jgi:AraC family transcriptional regulator of adaptative response/methylated-DNA-[protein]-cysteine methyltransferase